MWYSVMMSLPHRRASDVTDSENAPGTLRSGYMPAVMRSSLGAKAPKDTLSATQEVRSGQETDAVRRAFARIDLKHDGRLDREEIAAYLYRVGYNASAAEVDKLIWEVDDDGDGLVSWKEFQHIHLRLLQFDFETVSHHAFEPRGFFNVVEFAVHDRDGDGKIDSAEIIALFYRRYGKSKAFSKIKELFEGDSLDSRISFLDFVEHDNRLRRAACRAYMRSTGLLSDTSAKGRQELFADRGSARGRVLGVDKNGKTIRTPSVELGRVQGRPMAISTRNPKRPECLMRPI